MASFSYLHTWYNVSDVAGQMHTTTFAFQQGHLHCEEGGNANANDDGVKVTASGEGDNEPGAAQHPWQGTSFIRSWWTLRGTTRNHVMVNFRPVLKACTGWVTMMWTLSLLLGWPNREMLLLGQGKTSHMAPTQSMRNPVESLFMHCNLAADAHMVGNVRNCLLCTVPTEGNYGQVLQASVAVLAVHALDRVQARPHGYNQWSWPKGPIWRWDVLGQATDQVERWLLSDLKTSSSLHHHHQHRHNNINNTMVASNMP